MTGFFGKYRGKVENNVDPKNLGRLQISVPAVLGDGKSSWAMPCVPYAGKQVGFFSMPANGTNIWVEFENGDPDYPIWTGCFWGDGELPQSASSPDIRMVKANAGTITINESKGSEGITIETASGMKISITSSGIEINDGKGGSVKLSSGKVSINDSALEVM